MCFQSIVCGVLCASEVRLGCTCFICGIVCRMCFVTIECGGNIVCHMWVCDVFCA